jgi:hypothetical protein
MLFCFIFLQAATPPAAQQNTFYESLKGPPEAPLLKTDSTNFKNTRYTFKQKQNMCCFCFLSLHRPLRFY